MAQSIFFYTDSREIAGAENALFTLIEALDRQAWNPTLLLDAATGTEQLAKRGRALDIPVLFAPETPLGLKGARRVPALVRLLRRERPAVFHAHLTWPMAGKFPLAAAVAARVPAVVATVQLIPPVTSDRSNLLQLRLLARRVGRFIAVSRDIATGLVDDFGWPADRIEVIHNAVEAGRFVAPARASLRDLLTEGGDRAVVLVPARLNEQKGHSFLLRAAAQLPEAVFVLAGDGPIRDTLEAQAAELGVERRIRFLGYRSDIPQLLAASDLVALPSLYEGSSVAILEAMAAGRAVVASAIGGTDELIEDGKTGILVPPGEVDPLAAALRRLLDDPELRRSIADAARRRVERDFNAAAMAGRVEKVYDRLLVRAL